MTQNKKRALLALACGSFILALNMGIRQSQGLLIPNMMLGTGWNAGTFALALAVQNLLWGAASPLAGMIADRYGSARTLVSGALLYAIGLALMGLSKDPWIFHGSAGLLVGLGVAGTTFPIVLGAVGRAFSEEKRSLALGIAAAGGSFGQFVMAPVTGELNSAFGYAQALMLLGLISLLMAPAGLALMGRAAGHSTATVANGDAPSLGIALRSATQHRGFWLLNLGFFVCGFHVSFIAVHLPMFVSLSGLAPSIAATGLALIGLFNIFGTLIAGYLGGRYRKKWLLSGLYGLRAVIFLVFFFSPITATTLLVFSAAIGFTWLPTVPLTSGIVAQIFGPRFLASLFGVVMFFHQIGAFFGAWLGGVILDRTGNFDLAWIISIALGIIAMLVHLPMRDAKIEWGESMDLAPATER